MGLTGFAGGMIALLFRLWALRKLWLMIRGTRRRSDLSAAGQRR